MSSITSLSVQVPWQTPSVHGSQLICRHLTWFWTFPSQCLNLLHKVSRCISPHCCCTSQLGPPSCLPTIELVSTRPHPWPALGDFNFKKVKVSMTLYCRGVPEFGNKMLQKVLLIQLLITQICLSVRLNINYSNGYKTNNALVSHHV